MLKYSRQLRLDRTTFEPTNKQYASLSFDIGFSLLHDVILLELRAYVMKYKAMKKRKAKEKVNNLESEIHKFQNSNDEEDRKRVDSLKEELQNVEDEQKLESFRRTTWKVKGQRGSFVQLEYQGPTGPSF